MPFRCANVTCDFTSVFAANDLPFSVVDARFSIASRADAKLIIGNVKTGNHQQGEYRELK